MRIAVVGSRAYPHEHLVRAMVAAANRKYGDDLIIVSGGAPGVDTWAEETARGLEVATLIFPARWGVHGRPAGMRRNPLIVGAADTIVAFWDEQSGGTASSMDLALSSGKKVIVYGNDGSIILSRDASGSARKGTSTTPS